jgi:hypothetical protein
VAELKSVGEALPLLGQLLVLFAEAVCADLPVPLCCNNRNCQELLGANEQRLLTVKSVCPRCWWVTVPELHSTFNVLAVECHCQQFSPFLKHNHLRLP